MKSIRPICTFICVLFLVSGLGMLLDVLLSTSETPTDNPAHAATVEPTSTPNSAPSSAEDDANSDIPVGSPVAYPAEAVPGSVCQAALAQYLSYVEARASYLLRVGAATDDISKFLASREQAVIGELAIMAAQTGTFSGNPDHYHSLTTLAAERQATELAKQWHLADDHDHPRAEVKTYDITLQC